MELDEVAADELGVVTGSAMLKDETRCIRCGLCAMRCPVGHHHDGVLQPGPSRTDRADFHCSDRCRPQAYASSHTGGCDREINMTDEKKTFGTASVTDLNRRQFFVKLGLGSLGIAAAGTAVFAYQYLSPNVLYEPSPMINAGKPESFPLDSVTLDVNSGIYIIHSEEGFFSLSAVCTHLGCLTAWKPDLGIIACPCHGSKFKPRRQTRLKARRPSLCHGNACGSTRMAISWSIGPPIFGPCSS